MFSPEEVTQAYMLLARRSAEARQRRQKEREQTIARLRLALEEVAPRFAVHRVYLYGSVLTDRWCPASDLDLAVEGKLAFEHLLKLWAELDRRLEREVDVRELESLPFADKVRAEGVVVYERETAAAHG